MGWKECGIVGSNRALQGFELPFIQRRLLGDVLQTITDCSLLEQVNRSSSFKAPPLDLGLLGPGLDSCSPSSWGADVGVSEAAVGPLQVPSLLLNPVCHAGSPRLVIRTDRLTVGPGSGIQRQEPCWIFEHELTSVGDECNCPVV